MRERAATVVYGPATFLNRAVAAVNTEVGSLTVSAVETNPGCRSGRAGRSPRPRSSTRRETSAAVQAAGTLALEHELASTGTTSSTTGTSTTGTGATGAQALLAGVPSINDPAFLRQIVFGSATDTSKPSARFSYLFPNDDAAVIQVRLRAGLSDRQQQQAIDWIRAAVDTPSLPRLRPELHGHRRAGAARRPER